MGGLRSFSRRRPARSRGNLKLQRSTGASSMKARSLRFAGRVAHRRAARGHPAQPNDFVFSTVESAPPNRVFQGVRSGRRIAPYGNCIEKGRCARLSRRSIARAKLPFRSEVYGAEPRVSVQSTISLRSAKSHCPFRFTNLSR